MVIGWFCTGPEEMDEAKADSSKNRGFCRQKMTIFVVFVMTVLELLWFFFEIFLGRFRVCF